MPGKAPHPWFRESKQAWYVYVGGKLNALGKDREEAFRRFHLLMAGEQAEPKAKEMPKAKAEPQAEAGATVETLAKAYLTDVERRLAATPCQVAKWMVRDFAGLYGKMKAEAVRKHHVDTWIGKHPRWGDSTENLAKTRIGAMYRWGVEQGLLSSNPIQSLKKPPIRSRGQQALIAPEDHARMMEAAFPALRDVLLALHLTGARPGEVSSVTAADFDAEAAVWILTKHKTARKTGKPRLVFLCPEAVSLCRELAVKHPEGPLFRNAKGNPWHEVGISKRVRELRERLGLKSKAMPYGYRHTFATDALANGVPDAQVAALMGHSGTTMLHRHYAHLTAQSQALREALNRVR